jgi:hypothetical protein
VNGCYECLDDYHCPGTDCKAFDNSCVKCTGNADCLDASWHCDTASGACHECLQDSHCTPEFCDTTNHVCVQCRTDADCGNPSFPTCGKDKTCIPPCSDGCVKDSVICDPGDPGGESYLTCGDWDNDPCLEYGDSAYCPDNQYCSGAKCVCKPPACTEGKYACDPQYPTTVFVCEKDANGCLGWGTYMVCNTGNCKNGACP